MKKIYSTPTLHIHSVTITKMIAQSNPEGVANKGTQGYEENLGDLVRGQNISAMDNEDW
ncbi:MAG: hypothetical protein HUK00_03580 [Bacteroidaceae bacterium]|nr:hypothetical protein [Bacteroidaceae bacterium]